MVPETGVARRRSGRAVLIYDFHVHDQDIERCLREAGAKVAPTSQ